MVSVIEKLPTNFTDTALPKLYRDPVMNAGSLLLFDFLNSYSNPNADGALSTSSIFKNMVDGASDGVLTSVTAVPVNVTGKQGIIATGGYQSGNASRIELGAAIPTGVNPFVATVWLKQTGIVPAANQNQLIFGDSDPATSKHAWSIFAGTTGKSEQAIQRNGGTIISTNTVTDGFGLNVVTQYAVSWLNGNLSFYANGALVGTVVGFASGSIPVTGLPPRLNFYVPGTYYRVYAERTDLSGRTALAAVADDYAKNSARFT